MRKKALCLALVVLLVLLCAACGRKTKPLADGTYHIAAALTGGTGKAKIASPVQITVTDHAHSAVKYKSLFSYFLPVWMFCDIFLVVNARPIWQIRQTQLITSSYAVILFFLIPLL
jgi:hypothetical protein